MYAMNASLPVGARGSYGPLPCILRAAGCVLVAALVACGGSDAPDPTSGSAPEAETGSETPAGSPSTTARKEPKTIDPATVGSVHGVVSATGTPPVQKPLPMSSEPFCVAAHQATGGLVDDRIQVNDGRLESAFVWVKSGLEDYEFDAPDTPVELDQVGCMYTPRVVGAMPGQPVVVVNSDAVMHNVHTHPDRNRPQNIAQIAGSAPRELEFKKPEVMVKVACDVHAWMSAWIGVVDNPFFAVSAADGTYSLDGLPPGEFTLGVWHEKLGEREVTVVLDAGANIAAGPVVFEL